MTSCQCLIYALCNILTNLKANMRSSVFCSWNNSYNLRKYACKLHTTSINEPVLYNNTPIWTHHVNQQQLQDCSILDPTELHSQLLNVTLICQYTVALTQCYFKMRFSKQTIKLHIWWKVNQTQKPIKSYSLQCISLPWDPTQTM